MPNISKNRSSALGSNISQLIMTAHKPGDPLTLNRLYGRSKGKHKVTVYLVKNSHANYANAGAKKTLTFTVR